MAIDDRRASNVSTLLAQKGKRRRLPFGNHQRGRRAAKASARVVFETRKAEGWSWSARGNGSSTRDPALRVRASVGTETTIRSQILAERKPPRKRDLPEKLETSTRPRALSMGLDDTHRRSRPRSRHPPRGKGRVEHRNERGPTFRFVVCRVLPGDIALRPCCDGRELGESSECVPSDEGVPRARNRNPISLCFVL